MKPAFVFYRPGNRAIEAVLGLESTPDADLLRAIVLSGVIIVENGIHLDRFRVYHRIVSEREQKEKA